MDLFDLDERLEALSAKVDALKRVSSIVEFELFRSDLVCAVPCSDGVKGGRPPFDLMLVLKGWSSRPAIPCRTGAQST